MKPVYIFLAKTNTLFSRCYNLSGHNEYSHVSISIDDEFTHLYSFARKYEKFILPGGFISENIYTGIYKKQPTSKCVLYEIMVSESSYSVIENNLKNMLKSKNKYKYSLRGLILCFFNIAYEKDLYYFCSQFVSEVLLKAKAIDLPKEPSLMRPDDFKNIVGLKKIYSGTIHGLCETVSDKNEWNISKQQVVNV